MDGDALKLALVVLAALLVVRVVAGALFAVVAVGAGGHGAVATGSIMLPGLLAVGGLLGLVIAGAYYALDDGEDEALEELRKAYARGDIDEEEYEHRRERLTQR